MIPPILDHAQTLADATRCRVLGVLEGQELTVSELCQVLQLPQSTVSRHLKTLADGGWLAVRSEGTSRLYEARNGDLEPGAAALWGVVRPELAAEPAWRQDGLRLESVLAKRRSRSEEFFAETAGAWDELRARLFGERFDDAALLALLPAAAVAGDLGCGTGRLAQRLAPWVARVVAVDGSAAMLEAARRRLGAESAVELRQGELEKLPVADGELDLATLFLTLHHVAEPERVLAEVARALAPGGRLLLVDMLPHDREAFRREMGHVWLGFSRDQTALLLAGAGLAVERIAPLPPDPDASGPALFVATAMRTGPNDIRRSGAFDPRGETR